MALWLTLGSPPVWSLFVCVAVLAIGQSVFRPALQTVLPALAGDVSHLPAANALLDTTERIARLLGPGLVGVASTVLPLVQFVTIDAASFAVSAAAVLAITRIRPAAPAPQTSRGPILANVLRGFRAIRRNGLLQFSLMTTPVTNGAWYASVFLGVPLLVQRYGAGGLAAYGAVISAYGLTNLASTLVVGSLGVARHPARWIDGGNLVLGCGIAGFGVSGLLAPPEWLFACLLASSGLAAIGGPMQDITMATLRQTALPGADLPAGVRAFMVLNALGTLVALAASPRLFDEIGVPWAILLCAAAILAVGVTGLLRHGGDLMAISPGPRTE
jgi:hypothetical protein